MVKRVWVEREEGRRGERESKGLGWVIDTVLWYLCYRCSYLVGFVHLFLVRDLVSKEETAMMGRHLSFVGGSRYDKRDV